MTASFHARLLERSFEWVATAGVRVIVIGIVATILLYPLRRSGNNLERILQGSLPSPAQVKRAATLTHVVRDVAQILILGVGALMVLSELEMDLKPLLAAAGIGGLAIGFGAQNLVKDMISGFFILLEDQLRVGDVVEIAGVSGQVEEVG